jgi:hypothetical protein
MTHRSSFLTAAAVVLGLAAGAASPHAETNPTRLTYLTFSGPVGLPGVTLAAGTYAFELADITGVNNIVAVRSRTRSQTYFMGFTERIARPAGMAFKTSVSLGEARRGEVTPIVAWYPPDSSNGLKFIYRR